MPPGSRALGFASRWFDPAIVHRTFEPLVADWQREWQDAATSKRPLISLRQSWGFIRAVVISAPYIVKTPVPRELANKAVLRMVYFIAIVTTLLMIRPIISLSTSWANGASWMRASLFLFAAPGALALAFPFAMAGAVDTIRNSGSPQHVERAAAVKLAVLATLFMLIYTGWVIPTVNQASQAAMNPSGMSAPLRRIDELTTLELTINPARATVFAGSDYPASRDRTVQRELNTRLAITVLPMVLVWLRWSALNRSPRRWFSPLPPSVAGLIAMAFVIAIASSGFSIEREWHLWSGSQYWLPLALMVLWGKAASVVRSGMARA